MLLSGPVSVMAQTGTVNGRKMTVITLADLHESTEGMCPSNAITPDVFIKDVARRVYPRCVDVFIEELYALRKNPLSRADTTPIRYTGAKLYPYLTKSKFIPSSVILGPINFPYQNSKIEPATLPNLRVHGINIREFDPGLKALSDLVDRVFTIFMLDTNVSYIYQELYKELLPQQSTIINAQNLFSENRPRLLKQLQAAGSLVDSARRDFYKMVNQQIQRTQALFQKYGFTDPNDFYYRASTMDINPADVTDTLPYISFVLFMNKIRSFTASGMDLNVSQKYELSDLIGKFLLNSALIPAIMVDLYTFARMMRTFNVSTGKGRCITSPTVDLAIIYAGRDHVVNYRKWLSELGFQTVFEGKPVGGIRCFDITGLWPVIL